MPQIYKNKMIRKVTRAFFHDIQQQNNLEDMHQVLMQQVQIYISGEIPRQRLYTYI